MTVTATGHNTTIKINACSKTLWNTFCGKISNYGKLLITWLMSSPEQNKKLSMS